MDISRRFFIGGAAAFGAFGAFGGNRFLLTRDFKKAGKPNLTFGVVSDIHITHLTIPGVKGKWGGSAEFLRTLEWFRDQGVDAVVIAGDMAHTGFVDQLEAVAAEWYKVFPDDRHPDGHKVEKVFVTGNHDSDGHRDAYRKLLYSDTEAQQKKILRADFPGHWKRIFHEDYSKFYAKTINGYTFLGTQWEGKQTDLGKCTSPAYGVALKEYLDAQGKALDPKLPFFYVQHPHLKDTCYGPWAWGHDGGLATTTLSPYPNAIAFSGHSHYTLTDERSIWQDTFTSVGTSSLRYTCYTEEMYAPVGFDNASGVGKEAWRHNALKLTPKLKEGSAQGMLWRVYDDCIVAHRRDFAQSLDFGEDWVMPLTTAEDRPFAFATRTKKYGVPEFAEGATLKVSEVKAKNRGGKSGTEEIPSVEKDALEVEIPAAKAEDRARALEYEVTAVTKSGKKLSKHVLAVGACMAPASKKSLLPTKCLFAKDELDAGEIVFTVIPRNCYGVGGKPLVATASFAG